MGENEIAGVGLRLRSGEILTLQLGSGVSTDFLLCFFCMPSNGSLNSGDRILGLFGEIPQPNFHKFVT